MQYPKPKLTSKNPYTVEREFQPIAQTHTHEVIVQQGGGCTVITRHYAESDALAEYRYQRKQNIPQWQIEIKVMATGNGLIPPEDWCETCEMYADGCRCEER